MIAIATRLPRWFRPLALAAVIGALSLAGRADVLSDAAALLGDKDLLIRWTSALSGAARGATPVTLIDVDAETMALYGAPDRAPRDLLAGLIDLAGQKRPRGVFLDIDIGKPGVDAEADAKLRAVLAGWRADAPVLALSRRFVETPGRDGKTALAPAPFAFAEAAAGRANIRQAASLALVDADSVVRRWRLTQAVCEGATGVAFPSPQLVAASLDAAPQALDAFLDWRGRAVCAQDKTAAPAWPRNPADEANIAFLFSGAPGAPAPAIERAGRETLVFRRIPARSLLDARRNVLPPRAVADDLFVDRFVVIGATHAEAHDAHLTPLGRLPGVVILANAIVSAPAALSSLPLSPWGRTLAALALFGALAAISRRLRPLVAAIVVALACLALAPALGRLIAPPSALEIIFAALAMLALFASLESAIEMARDWRARGWRAMLKKPKQEGA